MRDDIQSTLAEAKRIYDDFHRRWVDTSRLREALAKVIEEGLPRQKISPLVKAIAKQCGNELQEHRVNNSLDESKETITIQEHEKILDDHATALHNKICDMDFELENLARMTITAITNQQSIIKATQERVEKLTDANLKAQEYAQALAEIKAQGDRQLAELGEMKKTAVETRRDQLTRAHYDRVNSIPKDKRKSGGGRKKERDIGDKQVKAVIALSPATRPRPLMECCRQVIRRGGKFVNPYTNARSLASRVSYYCKKTGTRSYFKTRSGKWSAKS